MQEKSLGNNNLLCQTLCRKFITLDRTANDILNNSFNLFMSRSGSAETFFVPERPRTFAIFSHTINYHNGDFIDIGVIYGKANF